MLEKKWDAQFRETFQKKNNEPVRSWGLLVHNTEFDLNLLYQKIISP